MDADGEGDGDGRAASRRWRGYLTPYSYSKVPYLLFLHSSDSVVGFGREETPSLSPTQPSSIGFSRRRRRLRKHRA